MTATKGYSASIKKASLFYFVWIMYSYTTAGPFGLEDQVTTAGPGMTLIYQLTIPFLWCIPMSLVVAELTTAMPVNGGFYRWVHLAFGDFWGFLAGWWDWGASFMLGSAYAVIFADYLSFYFPQIAGWQHYLVAVALIAAITCVNIRGIRMVGGVATALEAFVLLPVAFLCVVSLSKWRYNPFSPLVPPHRPLFQVFGVGLALGLWLYSGYEELSTVAEEVENPQRTYPRALAWVVPLSIATYFVPTLFTLAALGNWQQWHTRYFADAAQALGGRWLGDWMTLAAAVTYIAILNTTLLASTRIPSAMSEDGYLPAALARLHPRFGTPWVAILVSAIIYALLANGSFTQLITLYIWLHIAASILTLLSAWQLRRTRPDLPRPFRIPGGHKGLVYVVGAPLLLSGLALLGSDRFTVYWGSAALLFGPLVYFFVRHRRQHS